MAGKRNEIGRVCPYAHQRCTLATGCVTHEGPVFGVDVLSLEFRSLGCAKAGGYLFAGELASGRLSTRNYSVKRRVTTRLRLRHWLDGELRRRVAKERA